MRKTIPFFDDPTDFSLVQGGPVFQLLLRAGLVRPPVDLLARRMMVALLLTWAPLLLLSIFSGRAVGGPGLPFLFDLGAQVRFLAGLPLFLFADVVVHRRMKPIVRQFLDRGLIAPEEQSRFEGIIASAMRLRSSMVAEVVLLVFAMFGGQWLKQRYLGVSGVSWLADQVDGQTRYTAAGYWYFFVSMTLFRFVMLRWYFRIFVWYRFLWQVARHIHLRLNPLHPDRAGGLSFLAGSVFAFSPILLAQTVMLSGILGGRIWHEGATLPQFKLEIATWMGLLILVVLTPLYFFILQLGQARRAGLRDYGMVASRYVEEFRRKWIEGHAGKDEALMGTADIQSLADLASSFEVVSEMRLVPFGKVALLRLATIIVLPFTPLLLTMMPLEELLDRAMEVLL